MPLTLLQSPILGGDSIFQAYDLHLPKPCTLGLLAAYAGRLALGLIGANIPLSGLFKDDLRDVYCACAVHARFLLFIWLVTVQENPV